jgi:hypothetical protein
MVHKGDLPKFDPAIYSKIALTDLLVYSMYYLHNQGSEITSEDIISACFLLFPKRFSLRKYPHWPDSAVVSRRWSDCRKKGYIVGSTIKGFKLTPKGFRFAEKVGKTLGRQRQAAGRVLTEIKTRAGRFVRSIETSDAFIHYKKNGRNSRISEFEFRSMLLCTMESSAETLKRNLEQFKEYVSIYNRRDLSSFLDLCEDRFSYLLSASRKYAEKQVQRKKK